MIFRVVNIKVDNRSSSGGEFGDGFGTLRDGVLGELSWKDESDSRLDFSGGEGGSLVVLDELGGFTGEFTEDVVDEGVHDGHGSLGDTGLWVNLLQDSVDVDGEGLCSLLMSSDWSLLGWGVSSGFSWHFKLNLLKELQY